MKDAALNGSTHEARTTPSDAAAAEAPKQSSIKPGALASILKKAPVLPAGACVPAPEQLCRGVANTPKKQVLLLQELT